MRKVWSMIHKIQGINVKQPIKHLNFNGQTISNLPDVANILQMLSHLTHLQKAILQPFNNIKLQQNNIVFSLHQTTLNLILLSLTNLKMPLIILKTLHLDQIIYIISY